MKAKFANKAVEAAFNAVNFAETPEAFMVAKAKYIALAGAENVYAKAAAKAAAPAKVAVAA